MTAPPKLSTIFQLNPLRPQIKNRCGDVSGMSLPAMDFHCCKWREKKQ